MTDPAGLAALSASGLLALGLASAALLRAWHGWLELRRTQIERGGSSRRGGARSEVSQLRERVRRLETIADGGAS